MRDRSVSRQLVDSGLVDPEWFAALTGTVAGSAEQAARSWRSLADPLVAPSPLLLGDDGDRSRIDAYLSGDYTALPHPVFDDAIYLQAHSDAADHPGGPRGYFVQHAQAGTPLPVSPTWPVAAPTWESWRRAMLTYAVVFHEHRAAARTPMPALVTRPRQAAGSGRPAFVVAASGDWQPAADTAFAALGQNSEGGTQVLVADCSPLWHDSALYAAAFAGSPVTVAHSFIEPAGQRIVTVHAGDQLQPGSLELLCDALSDGASAAGPVILNANATIASAGLIAGKTGRPRGFLLAGHPAQDALLLPARIPGITGYDGGSVSLADGAQGCVIALHAQIISDAALSLPNRSEYLLSRAAVRELMAGAGFEVVSWSGDQPDLVRIPRNVQAGRAAGLPSLRWAVKLPGPDSAAGLGIVAALRRLGQEVVADLPDAWVRPSAHLDDVTVVIGPDSAFQRRRREALVEVAEVDEARDGSRERDFDQEAWVLLAQAIERNADQRPATAPLGWPR